MIARLAALATLVALALVPLPAGAQDAGATGRWANGEPFRYHYFVTFWRASPPGTTLGETPDEAARGRIFPAEIDYQSDAVPRAQAALFARKARLAVDALLAQPSLREIRGFSLRPRIRIDRFRSGRFSASVSIFVTDLRLALPTTVRSEGGYFTPDQPAAEIRVKINSLLDWNLEDPETLGSYNGTPVAIAKTEPFVYVTANGRTPIVPGDTPRQSKQIYNMDFYDAALPPTRVQYVAARAFYGSWHRGLWDGTAPPTGKVGRMVAAILMVDWRDLVRRMEAAG
ncbi:hypothetical protein FHS95_000822 [Sphingomonas naasensis]|uniref:DUF3108 domain-containing protein n=1 Tax=Sphingomonas naasensis TaxID=1344951 RepID=A0A4V3QXG4_9SPHN|nr:hypothetical protein [Sphingomonas naasensis]NIJ19153.1 hypothetical protein [Sphingomonas naasensis]TGX46342.1 hypothetical protein E5A74_04100 [Sphingomonas naasensis]